MAVDSATTTSTIGIDGNSYTEAVSNDQLTNEDFLRLMLEEMKMQDPTKPMDSAALMDSQLQMSTIDANMKMAEAMTAMQGSYASSALSTAANMIGHIVEDGSMNSEGLLKSYQVDTVENKDGELFVNAKELVGITDALVNNETEELTLYDANGNIYEDDVDIGYKVSLDADGRFNYNEDGTLMILDGDNEVVTDEEITSKYLYGGSSVRYAEETTTIALSNVQEVR
ncbi:MAG: flagellar hook capping FlgD N-terminal domain-containing protein [Campylobacterota bacterium]|nr:flagellar hook capping FlgD N-terminal domain-containing protein [Campylobacterota bacterium]